MAHDEEHKLKSRTARLSVRMEEDHLVLVEQAAEREGLQISSFIIMLLVRLHILPESCMAKIKRRPVPLFNALHGLLGVVNKIGGNCKQLAAALPDTEGLDKTHMSLIRTAAYLTDALQGAAIPEEANLYRLHENITKEGLRFNQIVKSVNVGRPNLAELPAALAAIRNATNAITSALTGNPAEDAENLMEMAMMDMRANMKKAALAQTKRQTDDA